MSINLNNRYGECCNCPAFMEDQGRIITNYMSSRTYHSQLRKELNINDSNDLRMKLQNEGLERSQKEFNNMSGCQNNGNNKFYVDKSKYTFTDKLDPVY
jgi:hypothetical protein